MYSEDRHRQLLAIVSVDVQPCIRLGGEEDTGGNRRRGVKNFARARAIDTHNPASPTQHLSMLPSRIGRQLAPRLRTPPRYVASALRTSPRVDLSTTTRKMAEETLFDKIVAKKIPSTAVYEDDQCYAFRDSEHGGSGGGDAVDAYVATRTTRAACAASRTPTPSSHWCSCRRRRSCRRRH